MEKHKTIEAACPVIDDLSQLEMVPKLLMDRFQWKGDYRPEAFARVAVLKGYGIVVSMTAMEKDPLCTYHNENDPVYRDSAMEFFISFPHPEGRYLNFEMNARGAMLSGCGYQGKKVFLHTLTPHKAEVSAQIREDRWNVVLKIPMVLLNDIFGIESLGDGDSFRCNLYKICEDPSLEHYASWGEITSPVPNFHLPEYFGHARIRE